VTSSAGSDNHFDYILFVTIEYIFTSNSVLKLFITIVKRIRREQVKGEDKLVVAVRSIGGRRGQARCHLSESRAIVLNYMKSRSIVLMSREGLLLWNRMFVCLVYWRRRERERKREICAINTAAGWPCGLPDCSTSLEPPRHCGPADIIALA
jgi:hypothetical protein